MLELFRIEQDQGGFWAPVIGGECATEDAAQEMMADLVAQGWDAQNLRIERYTGRKAQCHGAHYPPLKGRARSFQLAHAFQRLRPIHRKRGRA